MTEVPTSQTPRITRPLVHHNTKGKLDYIPHLIDLFDESVCESAEENLLHLKELKDLGSFTKLFYLPEPTNRNLSKIEFLGLVVVMSVAKCD